MIKMRYLHAEVLPVWTMFLFFILSCCQVRFSPAGLHLNEINEEATIQAVIPCNIIVIAKDYI